MDFISIRYYLKIIAERQIQLLFAISDFYSVKIYIQVFLLFGGIAF